MLGGLLVMGGLGALCGVGLALASKIFYVYVDPKQEAVTDALPGANCGGCGFAGCAANAAAIVAGKSSPSSCVAGGPDVAAEIGRILGVSVEVREPRMASPGCRYGVHEADLKYLYAGISDCRAAMLLSGGSKTCPIGCLGLGTCVRACPFGALSLGPDNLPVVDTTRCTGCGTCERVCPKHIITLTSTSERMIGEYVTDECTAPCQRSCPTGINIPAFIREIRNGHYEAALAIIQEKCPLPLICGYICPAPCEQACRRNLVDEAVAINPLKRFVADYEMRTGNRLTPFKAPGSGEKIAVVGGGAEGLTLSYYLARLGYHPTILEAKPLLGGILRYVIAEDRLPRKVLDHEIQGILNMGVEARTNVTLGRDVELASLLGEGFDAVVLAKGGFDSRQILQTEPHLPDVSVPGVFIMLDFIQMLDEEKPATPIGRAVLVHDRREGLDLARRCMAAGAQKVTIVSGLPLRELPLEMQDSKRLAEEGITVLPAHVVIGLQGISRRLVRVSVEDTDPEGGFFGEQDTIRTDTLILPLGRLPELVFVRSTEGEEGLEAGEVAWRTIEAFRTFPGKNEGILTAPEPGRISDSSATVKSLLSGRRLCRAIHRHFTAGTIQPIDHLACEADSILNVAEVHHVAPSERERPAVLDVSGDTKQAWIFPSEYPGLDEAGARKEAERCLSCGLICYRKQV